MVSLTESEVEKHFEALLKRVELGEEIVILRDGKPIAKMLPAAKENLEKIREAVGELRRVRQKMARRLGSKLITDKEIKEAIEEGRR